MTQASRALLGPVIGFSLVAAAGQAASAAEVLYTVSMPRARENLIDVELRVRAALPLNVAMPIWAPGAYRLVNWSRNVRPGTARSSTGEVLSWRRSGRSGWTIVGKRAVPAPQQLTIRYQVLASALDSDSSYVDSIQAHLVGSSVFMYVPAVRGEPQRVTLKLPRYWHLVTSTLPRRGSAFAGHNYDEIADSIWQLGWHATRCATFRKAELCIALHTSDHHLVPPRWIKDLVDIAKVHADWFGGLPYSKYTVFVRPVDASAFRDMFAPGLEHDRGCTLLVNKGVLNAPMEDQKNSGYEWLVSTMAHEHFHVWNARRIRPAPYGVHDYLDPKPSQLLWFTEGFTKYYEARSLLAMGRTSQKRYLADLGQLIGDQKQACPQCAWKSLSDTSGDAFWPSRGAPRFPFYARGKLVATLLDIELRARTGGKVSLLHVLAALEHQAAASGGTVELTRDRLEKTIRSLSGHDLAPLLKKWVDTPGSIDTAAGLRKVGLQLHEGPVLGNLGFSARRNRAVLEVTTVERDGPAAKAGLKVGDRVLAVNSCRISPSWKAFLTRPGPCDLEVFRERFLNGPKRAHRILRRRATGHEFLHVKIPDCVYSGLVPIKAGPAAAKLRREWLTPPGSQATTAPKGHFWHR